MVSVLYVSLTSSDLHEQDRRGVEALGDYLVYALPCAAAPANMVPVVSYAKPWSEVCFQSIH